MLKKRYICILLIVIAGCSNTANQSENQENMPHPQKVRYEGPAKEADHLTYYKDYVDARELQKDNLTDNDFERYTDPYTTEESQEIAEKLMENRDIIVAEVRIVDKQVFVAVKLRENNYDRNHDMSTVTAIEDQVKEILDDEEKNVVIWTDHTQWNRMKNHYAEPEVTPFFDKFFKDNE
ncbi:YhcN/YlaJ family sporulation lipoprotein [Oceanobacillus sp. FSL H7-0719]|uniref:YhcN/YlaJ family sporulation lipoprotein n=1 Tax=Oceanobacillus sp. FSL H7-0719 TaxID=2954507 RepID=UPI00324E1BC5